METSATIETETTTATETEETATTETTTAVETETVTTETLTATTETGTQSKTDTTDTDNASTDIFTVTTLSKTMYTQKACNVREKPSTEYGVMAYLDKATEVKVTGKVNEVNWYEVSINEEKGYISAGLLADTKPAEQQAAPNTNTDTPAQTSPPASTPNNDTGNTSTGTDTPAPTQPSVTTNPPDENGSYIADGLWHLINPATGDYYKDGDTTPQGWTYGVD